MTRRYWMGCLMAALCAAGAGEAQTGPGAAPAHSAEKRTLMYTAEELAQITAAINEANRPKTMAVVQAATTEDNAPPPIPNIYVSAVADFGDGHWTVWANGYRIGPGRQAPGFQVVAVQDDQVDIVVQADPPAHIVLRPHQTWMAQSNGVVEGIFP